MKRVLLSLTTLLSLAATAQMNSMQSTGNKITFGIRAGVNFQMLAGDDVNGNKINNDLAVKYNAGVNAEIPLAENFYLQPGVVFTTKGAKSSFANSNTKTNLYYVDVPVNFVYKTAVGTGNILFGVGPYVGIGLGGKVKYNFMGTETRYDVAFQDKVAIGDDTNMRYFKRVEAGGNIVAGYEFNNRFSLQVNGQVSLTNIAPKRTDVTSDRSDLKNVGFGASLGYRF